MSFAAGFGAVTVTSLVDVQAAGSLSVDVIVLRMEVVVVKKRSWKTVSVLTASAPIPRPACAVTETVAVTVTEAVIVSKMGENLVTSLGSKVTMDVSILLRVMVGPAI
jgi:hypothetical protein